MFVFYSDFFFFKQKTAYEMRISDWSSDVCSSDLRPSDATSDSVPKAVLALPVALVESAILPTATLFAPVVLFVKAAEPIAVFVPPVVLSAHADSPIAVLFHPEERGMASCRDRVCQDGQITGVDVSVKKKTKSR